MRHERAHLFRVLGDQRERVDGAAARGEQVHGLAAQGRDQPVEVLGAIVRRRVPGQGLRLAAVDPGWIVGNDRPVTEVLRQTVEAARGHRVADHQQRRLGALGFGVADVVSQRATRYIEAQGLGFGHRRSFLGCAPSDRPGRRNSSLSLRPRRSLRRVRRGRRSSPRRASSRRTCAWPLPPNPRP